MERKIKFRAWDKENELMYMQNSIDETFSFTENGIVVDDNWQTDNRLNCEIMQYTGLHDKNNKEIYEGDICKVSCKYFNIKDELSKVIFKDGCFCFQYGCTDDYVKTFNAWDLNSVEVIGNIYENYETMK